MYFDTPWPSDQLAVAVIADDAGIVLEPNPRVLAPGSALRFSRSTGSAFRVYVTTYDGDPRLDSCAIRIGGTGDRLPEPRTRWRSPLIDEELSSGTFELTADPAPHDFDLRFDSCPPDNSCDVEVTVLTVEATYHDMNYAVMINRDYALAGGDRRPDLTTTFARIEGDRVTMLPGDQKLKGSLRGLAYDGARTVYAVTPDHFTILDLSGTPTATITTNGEPSAISLATDAGPFIRYGTIRVEEYRPGQPSPIELTDLPTAGIDQFLAIRSDHLFIFATDGAIFRYDGTIWRREVEGSELSWDAFAGTGELVIAVPKVGNYLAREGESTIWRDIGRPFDQFPKGAAILPGRRAIVTGEAGQAAMWLGERWCHIDTKVGLGLNSVAVSPDGRAAIIAGNISAEGIPVLLRLAL